MRIDFIIFIIIATLINILFSIVFYQNASNKKLHKNTIDYYSIRGIKIIEIKKLSLLEKFRYKRFFPYNPVYGTNIFMYDDTTVYKIYCRIIRLIDNNNKEFTKFIEIKIRMNEIEKIEEFDSFEF